MSDKVTDHDLSSIIMDGDEPSDAESNILHGLTGSICNAAVGTLADWHLPAAWGILIVLALIESILSEMYVEGKDWKTARNALSLFVAGLTIEENKTDEAPDDDDRVH